jgi:hypothetical protein
MESSSARTVKTVSQYSKNGFSLLNIRFDYNGRVSVANGILWTSEALHFVVQTHEYHQISLWGDGNQSNDAHCTAHAPYSKLLSYLTIALECPILRPANGLQSRPHPSEPLLFVHANRG